MSEAVDWAGLSSRLSAYSLSSEEEAAGSSEDEADTEDDSEE
jgi:hypothetical protein